MEDAQTDQEEIIRKAISVANEEILEKSTEDPNYEGMGTTLVACTIAENLMKVANVGDSRLYLLREHKITQITEDHSLVQEMVRLGKIDQENARNHPKKNIITKAVGVMPEVEADYFDVPLEKGDEILLCSDGLSNMLEDEEIRMIMEAGRDITEQAEALVRAANDHGGKDNISVIVIEPFAE
jgi:protein phosphatase